MYVIDYCGYNTHNPDQDVISRPNGSSSCLFLLIQSPMRFWFDNREVLVNPGACILYEPGFLQRYQAVQEFSNSYVHFYADPADMEPFSFPFNQILYLDCTDEINQYIKKIHREYLMQQPHSSKQIHALITQLMILLDRSCQQNIAQEHGTDTMYSEFQSIRLQMLSYCDEEWPAERLCQMLGLEKSQVYSYYRQYFHTTPKAELIHARIDKAKYLLTNEAMQISQVAQASGFRDIYHFSRYFKKICGCSPSRFVAQKKKQSM